MGGEDILNFKQVKIW